MSIVAPRSKVPASGGACFECRVRSEHLGVEWRACLFLCLGFIYGDIRVLSGGIDPEFLRNMTIAAPGIDSLDSG